MKLKKKLKILHQTYSIIDASYSDQEAIQKLTERNAELELLLANAEAHYRAVREDLSILVELGGVV